jgi:Zn-finger nucleic acid-binding protein
MTDGPYREAGTRDPEEPPPDPRGPWVLQTWASSLECPDCGIHLYAARKEGFRIDACGRCRGAWLDRSTSERAIDERSLVPAMLADVAASGVDPADGSPPSRRLCPDCRAPLITSRIADAGVVVDVCATHGTWFDPGEMRAVITAIVKRTPPAVDPEVDRIIAREAALGAQRPPADYRVPEGMFGATESGLDYASAVGGMLTDLVRIFRK